MTCSTSFCMISALVLALLAEATAVEVALVSGERLQADGAQVLSNQKIQLSPAGQGQVPLEAVAWWRLGPSVALTEDPLFAVLADGSWLPLAQPPVVVVPEQAEDGASPRLALATLLGEQQHELGSIIGFGPGSWLGRQAGQSDGDRLMTAVETLSVHVDALLPANADQPQGALQCTVPGFDQATVLQLADVQGLWLDVPQQAPRSALAWFAHDAWPPVYLQRSPAGWQTTTGLSVNEPPNAGRLVPVGYGRFFLARLRPSAVQEEGAFGVVWPYQKERNLDGSWPLRLDGVFGWQSLVIHSKAAMTWKLRGRYQRFVAQVGIADSVRPQGDLELVIMTDDQELFRQRLTGEQDSQWLTLDVRGAQELHILVEMGERFDIGDHLVLGQAMLIREQ